MTDNIAVGDTVTLKDNPAFRGEVRAVSDWGRVFTKVQEWGGETGGFRGQDGVLDMTSYPVTQLVKVEEEEQCNTYQTTTC